MVRKARYEDLENIMKIIDETIREMKTYNNTQWDETYPREEDFRKDVEKEDLFVLEEKGILKGFICINEIEPVEYKGIKWTSSKRAFIVHRMAVNSISRRQGVGTSLMKFADKLAREKGIDYLKTDTYSINENMKALFIKSGYSIAGEMEFLGKEFPFYCYEKELDKLLRDA